MEYHPALFYVTLRKGLIYMEYGCPVLPELGMPTLIETETPEAAASLCRDLGLRFVELNMNLPRYQAVRMDAAELGRIAEHYGIYFTIHLDENLNVSDFNPRVARAWRETVHETIALARVLGCPVLNMHLARGVYFTLPERRIYLYDQYREQYLRSLTEFRDDCTEAVGSSGVRICVENSDGFTQFQRDALQTLLESPAFALTLDIGHNHSAGGGDEAFILSRADRLAHMHVHDARGTKDHLALGTGELDIPRYLALAVHSASRAVLETKTVAGLRQSVAWLRAR